jgi:hypothetical protein
MKLFSLDLVATRWLNLAAARWLDVVTLDWFEALCIEVADRRENNFK